MGSLKYQQNELLNKMSNKGMSNNDIPLIEIISVLNDISKKIDTLNDTLISVDERLKKLESMPTSQQVVYTQVDNIPENPNSKKDEPASFIPTLHLDDMKAKGDAVKSNKKKRNLSSAAKNLKNINKESDDG